MISNINNIQVHQFRTLDIAKIFEIKRGKMDLLIINPSSNDKYLEEINKKNVEVKAKHLKEVGYNVKVVDESCFKNKKIGYYFFPKNNNNLLYKIPVLIERTENFDKYCSLLKEDDSVYNIEFDNMFSTTPLAYGSVCFLKEILENKNLTKINKVLIIENSNTNNNDNPIYKLLKRVSPTNKNANIQIINDKTSQQELLDLFWEAEIVFVNTGNSKIFNFTDNLKSSVKWANKIIIDYGNKYNEYNIDISKLLNLLDINSEYNFNIDIAAIQEGVQLSYIYGLLTFLNYAQDIIK